MEDNLRRLHINFEETSISQRDAKLPQERRAVLVLDDDPTIRLMIRVLLEVAAGVRIFEAANDEQALKLARQLKPDLLVSNLARPCRMDGLEFIKVFRAAHPQVPIIVVSGALDPVTRSWTFKFGVSACVTKLLASSKLAEVVRDVLFDGRERMTSRQQNRRDSASARCDRRCFLRAARRSLPPGN
jgi:DNA-binding NarL/FixJ family response regulator